MEFGASANSDIVSSHQDVTIGIFFLKKRRKETMEFFAWNLSTLSNHSANTCIKVITKIWIKSGKSGSILSTFDALFRVWQFFQVRGCYHQNRDLQSGGRGNHTKRAKE